MVKFTSLTLLAAVAASVAAKDAVTTTEMFIVGFTSQAMVASVIASDASATTFSVACATSSGCALPTSFTFTQGPSMIHYDYTHKPTASSDPSGSVDVGCTITSDHGVCSKTINAELGTITSAATAATTTYTNGGSDLGGQVVTITGGSLAVSSTSSSSARKTTSSSIAVVSSTRTVQPEASTTAAPSTSSSTTDTAFFEATKSIAVATSTSKAAGMPMITAPAHWVIGGAAAALALAAL